MVDVSHNSHPVEPPNSILQASLDDKGRLKFPSDFQSWLEAKGVNKVFITTFDLQLARIYSISDWANNLKVLQASRENPKAAQRLAFTAKAFGGEAEIDKSGRVLVPASLREKLGLTEKQAVHLEVFGDRINVYTQKVFDERMAVATANAADDLEALEKEGLQ